MCSRRYPIGPCFPTPLRSSIDAGKGRGRAAAKRTTGMIILRILANAVIMAGEVAAVAALAAFAFYYPFVFAGVTAALSFVLGLRLELARLRYELPFYFGGLAKRGTSSRRSSAPSRRCSRACWPGSPRCSRSPARTPTDCSGSRFCSGCASTPALPSCGFSIRADALPMRWGYFRLAPPLGLLFSAGRRCSRHGILPPPTSRHRLEDRLRDAGEPSIAQVSELFFQLKQAFDDFIVTVLGVFGSEMGARRGRRRQRQRAVGFRRAVYAALIASAVRRASAEDALL